MRAIQILVFSAWLSLVALFCQVVEAGTRAQSPVTVCSLAAHPENFAGKIVALSGELNSDGIERVVLTDEHCEDFGVAIMTPNHFKGGGQFRQCSSHGTSGNAG